jgi:hypothetical protein
MSEPRRSIMTETATQTSRIKVAGKELLMWPAQDQPTPKGDVSFVGEIKSCQCPVHFKEGDRVWATTATQLQK